VESRPATIVDTYLGYWAGDVLVAFLLVDFGGVIRAIGGQLLNSADEAANREYGERFAIRLMRACGARSWNELDGRRVDVLFDAPFPWGKAIGVRDAAEPQHEPFLFDQLVVPGPERRVHAEALEAVGVPRPLHAPQTSLVSVL
jgi:hypothetical protein